jgi:hypothetical protein
MSNLQQYGQVQAGIGLPVHIASTGFAFYVGIKMYSSENLTVKVRNRVYTGNHAVVLSLVVCITQAPY